MVNKKMKVVILAGGYGTRIAEESATKPKPMVVIGNKPILWHIMKIYSVYGHKDFIICCGYKGDIIKEYFTDHNNKIPDDWNIIFADTGEKTMTGGRLKKIKKYINEKENFLFTYGDGLSDVNINELIDFHNNHDSLCTVTAVYPPSRFGALDINHNSNKVVSFEEKPTNDSQMINGGFFLLNAKVFDFISGDETVWEREPMERLVKENNLSAYRHRGFFGPVDTLRDKQSLSLMWNQNKAKWKIWKN